MTQIKDQVFPREAARAENNILNDIVGITLDGVTRFSTGPAPNIEPQADRHHDSGSLLPDSGV